MINLILQYGDILEMASSGDIVMPTTNGIVKDDGTLVMGAGNARQFKETFIGLDKSLGAKVVANGNRVNIGGSYTYKNKPLLILSFPTKHHYKYKSSLAIIEQSCREIYEMYTYLKSKQDYSGKVRICAPGITNGHLEWTNFKRILERYLDENFIIHYLDRSKIDNGYKAFAGIGSRTAPDWVLSLASYAGEVLALAGYTLRSGAAPGMDSAFEYGCIKGKGKKEIFLPWEDFNNSLSDLYEVRPQALEIAKKYHPAWGKLSFGAKKLMGRNSYQVLGYYLDFAVDFILCYTKNGKDIGGTSQAIRIARDYNIPIFNIGAYNNPATAKENLDKFLEQFI